jgi:hypothetical protein
MGKDQSQFRDSHKHARDGRPQTGQQQRSGASRHQLQNGQRQRRRRQACKPMLDHWNSRHRAQKCESCARPTLGKCREKSLQKKFPFLGSYIHSAIETQKRGFAEPHFRVV